VSTISPEEIYERHIKPLPAAERLRLLAVMAQDLAEQSTEAGWQPKRSIIELHGLGAEIWQGIDAQEYVDALRQDRDHRP
jgi:hypothetical protein